MIRLPEAFTQRMANLLGDQYPAFLASYDQPRRYGLRVNTLKMSPERFEQLAPFHLTPIRWMPGAYAYTQQDGAARHPYYHAGLYYLQEPSAMTPANVLPVHPGDRVLDLCAAPGGKATALGARLAGRGLLVANDISAGRCRALLKNIEVFGIPNALITNEQPARLAERFPAYFDSVLVDAPCSGEGMFRKDEGAIRAWYPEKSAQCAKIQRQLVLQAADMLRPGGRLLYSTCTFAPEENEETVRFLLRERPGMSLLRIPWREGFSPGLEGLEQCVRLWPHKTGGEGHFLALLEKRETAGEAPRQRRREDPPGRSRSADRREAPRRGELSAGQKQELLEDFLGRTGIALPPGRLEFGGDMAFLVPGDAGMDPKGLNFLRYGLWLGQLRKDRFEPSQALAMAVRAPAGGSVLSLELSDERLMRYLRGETLTLYPQEAEALRGWVLVCAAGQPLGWGKCSGGLLKNKYLALWRTKY